MLHAAVVVVFIVGTPPRPSILWVETSLELESFILLLRLREEMKLERNL